ncbi:hypothetical protein [Herbiconiux sp.]|uniref:hypothetical protein n=1 Tax=Herbiconiux sp. TaxID=1871186 RepID=UPI0025BCB58C|nr:hypothetical protein [Herbiconiux sp.]
MTTLDSRSGHRITRLATLETIASPDRAPADLSTAPLPRLLVTRDPRHGVTLYAQRLAEALTEPAGAEVTAGERVHLHFTDRLWGSDPGAAASAVEELAQRASVTVTLHDLPQPSDGAGSLGRRAASYRRVVEAASGVVCNSHHEAELLAEYVGAVTAITVIPLPVDGPSAGAAIGADTTGAADAGTATVARATQDPAAGSAPAVSVLGYVYPGKGHDRVLRAVGNLRRYPRPVVEALGRASEGHEHDVENVRRLARYAGVAFTITGFLPDDELRERCRRSAVPVIAHRHVSASGSLASWLGAGRRPIVLASRYMQEMAALHRNALTVVDGRALDDAIEHALAHPESTRLDDSVRLGPDLAEVAALYRRFWAEVAW